MRGREGKREMGDVEERREREKEEGVSLVLLLPMLLHGGSKPCVYKQTKLHLPKPLQAVKPAHRTQCPLATGVSSPPVNTDLIRLPILTHASWGAHRPLQWTLTATFLLYMGIFYMHPAHSTAKASNKHTTNWRTTNQCGHDCLHRWLAKGPRCQISLLDETLQISDKKYSASWFIFWFSTPSPCNSTKGCCSLFLQWCWYCVANETSVYVED